jgi:hypothetical protein
LLNHFEKVTTSLNAEKSSFQSDWRSAEIAFRGQNTLPSREKSLSTAALDGNPVLSEMYRFRICGYKSNDDKS